MAAPSLPAALAAAWADPAQAGRTALVSDEGRLTYAALAARVGAAASTLRRSGIGRGDLVALPTERSLDTLVTFFAIQWVGACSCPLEPRLSPDETENRLASVGIEWLVRDGVARRLRERGSSFEAPLRGSLQDEEHRGSLLPPHAEVAGAAGPRSAHGHEPGPSGHDEDLGPADPALLLFTSGSTGRPKGVLLGHGNLLCNAAGVIARTGLGPSDRLLHVMPIHHTNGLNNQLFAPLLVGATVVFASRFKAELMPDLLARHRPTIITGVPTMYGRMLALSFDPDSLKGLRMARCGSAPITVELHAQVEEKLGCPLVVSYGLSEATCTSLMNPPDFRRIGTVGTVLDGQTVRLLRPGSTDEVPACREGEVAIAGPSVMLGYLGGDADASRAVQDGWLRTGDLGRFDTDGYLAITGRLKDVIIRGGENLSPLAIEAAIVADPDVAACCVVGRPDPDLGEIPVAFVVPRAGATPDPDALRARVVQALSRSYRPDDVAIVDALPENAVGKVDRKALAALAASGRTALEMS